MRPFFLVLPLQVVGARLGHIQLRMERLMADATDKPAESTQVGILKKKDFVDRAVARSQVKKADARAAIDAALSTLAEALGEGNEVILPPLGRLKVTRVKDGPKGKQSLLKLSLPKNEENAPEGVADTGDTD